MAVRDTGGGAYRPKRKIIGSGNAQARPKPWSEYIGEWNRNTGRYLRDPDGTVDIGNSNNNTSRQGANLTGNSSVRGAAKTVKTRKTASGKTIKKVTKVVGTGSAKRVVKVTKTKSAGSSSFTAVKGKRRVADVKRRTASGGFKTGAYVRKDAKKNAGGNGPVKRRVLSSKVRKAR